MEKGLTLEDINRLTKQIEQTEVERYNLIGQFFGVNIRVDDKLKGNEHYISVSKEAYDKIKETK